MSYAKSLVENLSYKMLGVLAICSSLMAVGATNNLCCIFFHQPEMPKELIEK